MPTVLHYRVGNKTELLMLSLVKEQFFPLIFGLSSKSEFLSKIQNIIKHLSTLEPFCNLR